MESVVVAVLRQNGLDRKGADPATPVILQSFDQVALEAMARDLPTLDRTFLLDARGDEQWLTTDGLRALTAFASGIGPAKALIDADSTLVARAHAPRPDGGALHIPLVVSRTLCLGHR